MDAREFDDLIARIAQASSRRTAVKGVLGGALAGAGIAVAADAQGKGKKGRKGKGRNDVASEHNSKNGKRTMCLCKEGATTTSSTTETPTTVTTQITREGQRQASQRASRAQARELVCKTKRFKNKKAKRALRKNPGSYRGPCSDATTSTSTSTSTTGTSTSTTSTTQSPPP